MLDGELYRMRMHDPAARSGCASTHKYAALLGRRASACHVYPVRACRELKMCSNISSRRSDLASFHQLSTVSRNTRDEIRNLRHWCQGLNSDLKEFNGWPSYMLPDANLECLFQQSDCSTHMVASLSHRRNI